MIKKFEKLSKTDEIGVLKLYEALVSKECSRPIDLELIVTRGFPAFEETIGAKDFEKIKRYFGIGVKKPSRNIREADIRVLLGKLRTIANARFYLDGFESMLEDIASKLDGAPEDWSTIIKAKFVRLFETIFCGYDYFLEDCVKNPHKRNQGELAIDYELALKNNKKPFNPEELWFLYDKRIKFYAKESLIFESMVYILSGARNLKEILHFAELRFNSVDGFTDTNATTPNQTFGGVRKIKKKAFAEPGVFPIETFYHKELILMQNMESLYFAYKLLKVIPLEEFDSVQLPIVRLEGSRVSQKTSRCYKIAQDFIVSGKEEAGCFINLLDIICQKRIKLQYSQSDHTKCDVSLYMSTVNFLLLEGYINYGTLKEDLEMAKKLIDADKTNALAEYRDGKISTEVVKKRIGIDARFEREVLGIEVKLEPDEIICELAVKFGYVETKEQIDRALIEQVLVPGNEARISSLTDEEVDLSRTKFEKILEISSEFADMFFDLKKVDISAIESKLLELKKKLAGDKEMKEQKSLIKLYCYLVVNEVPCGPKKKAPKRNKGLKPANLIKFIE